MREAEARVDLRGAVIRCLRELDGVLGKPDRARLAALELEQRKHCEGARAEPVVVEPVRELDRRARMLHRGSPPLEEAEIERKTLVDALPELVGDVLLPERLPAQLDLVLRAGRTRAR